MRYSSSQLIKRSPALLFLLVFMLLAAFASTSYAAEFELLPAGQIAPSSTEKIPAGKFKKDGPWVIGMSWPGMASTWQIQAAHESRIAAMQESGIKEFKLVYAEYKPPKQAADIKSFRERKVDAILIAPVALDPLKEEINAATAAGIPVIIFSSNKPSPDATLSILAGGEFFGRAGGEFLKERLHGHGNLWVIRGVKGTGEEIARYNGLMEAIKDSQIKVIGEAYGDWNYDATLKICRKLAANEPNIDGMWFSGGDQAVACIDAFKENHRKLIPMTGQNTNGYLRAWKASGGDGIAPIFSPGIGVAMVKAAVGLLKGESLYKTYTSNPQPVTAATRENYLRPELSDSYLVPSTLSDEMSSSLYAKRR